MKNFIRNTFLLFFSTIFVLSCTKENVKINESSINVLNTTSGLSEENILVFKDVETYEQTILLLSEMGEGELLKWEKELNFISLKTKSVNKKIKNIEPNEALSLKTILNYKGEIIIQDKLFKLDFNNETIDVFSENKNIGTYSFNDDVIEAVFYRSNELELKSDYCSSDTYKHVWNTSQGYVTKIIRYLTLGIYYELNAQIEKDHYGGALTLYIETDWNSTCFYKHKKGCWTYSNSESGSDKHYKMTPYKGTRRLKAYNMVIWFKCFDANTLQEFETTAQLGCEINEGC